MVKDTRTLNVTGKNNSNDVEIDFIPELVPGLQKDHWKSLGARRSTYLLRKRSSNRVPSLPHADLRNEKHQK